VRVPTRPSSPPQGPLSWVGRLALILATGLGSGYSPKAPGTVGTLAALPLCFLLHGLPTVLSLLSILAFVALAILVAGIAGRHFGNADDQRIVIDEWAGMLVATALMPLDLVTILLAFALFRLFDITKPWPARWIDQHVKNAVGNVMDDVVAGLYAWAVLEVFVRIHPW
jgi:phosphatidylglycerophosphatase A